MFVQYLRGFEGVTLHFSFVCILTAYFADCIVCCVSVLPVCMISLLQFYAYLGCGNLYRREFQRGKKEGIPTHCTMTCKICECKVTDRQKKKKGEGEFIPLSLRPMNKVNYGSVIPINWEMRKLEGCFCQCE